MSRRGLFGLLGAVWVSQLGTRMSVLAVPWLVLTATGSPTAAGEIAAAELLPYVLVQALGGPIVDRLGGRRTSVATDLGATLTAAAIAAGSATAGVHVAMLAVLMALTGALRGAGDGARSILVPVVAEGSGTPIERAAGLYDGAARLATLVGAPLAGGLIALTSAPVVVGIDAATFLASASILAATVRRPSGGTAAPGERPPYFAALREGFEYLRADRILLGIAVMVLVTNTIDQAQATVLTPVWARTVAHSPVALGAIGGTFSLGAVAGNAALSWLAPRMPRRIVYGAGYVLAGAPRYVAMALASTVAPVLPVALIAGLGAGGINPVLGAVEYERIPRRLQARVLGAVGATAWIGMPLGSVGGGALVAAAGIRTTLWLAAGAYLLTTLAPFVFPAWRGMERSPAKASVGATGV